MGSSLFLYICEHLKVKTLGIIKGVNHTSRVNWDIQHNESRVALANAVVVAHYYLEWHVENMYKLAGQFHSLFRVGRVLI